MLFIIRQKLDRRHIETQIVWMLFNPFDLLVLIIRIPTRDTDVFLLTTSANLAQGIELGTILRYAIWVQRLEELSRRLISRCYLTPQQNRRW